MYLLIKNASSMCNMQCAYCFYRDESEHRKNKSLGLMTEETALTLIKKALKHAKGSCTFIFQGGEPTLSGLDFFRHFVNKVREENVFGLDIHYSIQTNGQLIDEEWAKFFHDNHFLVGLSLDGNREQHDRLRGEGTHRKVMKAISILKRFEVDFNILSVVTSRTAKNVEATYDFFKKNNLYYQQYIPCLDSVDSDSFLNADEFGHFLVRLFRLWSKDAVSSHPVSIRYFDELILRLIGNDAGTCSSCGTCGIQYAVESNGDIYPCDFYCLDDYFLGNISECEFQQIDDVRSKIGFIDASKSISQKCRACQYYGLCRGGCRRDRDYFDGTSPELNRLCNGYSYFFRECIGEILSLAHFFSERQ